METGYLQKSVQKVADGYSFTMPSPDDMPKTGTGKGSLEQGQGGRLKEITEVVLNKYAKDIEKKAKNRLK